MVMMLNQLAARAGTAVFVACAAVACGGGGGGSPGAAPAAPAPAVPAAAVASLGQPSSGKLAWNLSTPATVTLKDGNGANLTGLSCTADDALALSVASDCSSLRGQRLGSQSITVSSGGVSAKLAVTVVPQAQPFGAEGSSGSGGSGGTVAALVPGSGLMLWGSNSNSLLGQSIPWSTLEYSGLPLSLKDPGGSAALAGVMAGSVGAQNGLALTDAGEVWTWGANGEQIGRSASDAAALVPGRASAATGSGSLKGIVAVAQGSSNVLALNDDGRLYSWGGYSGQQVARAPVPGLVLNSEGSDVLRNVVAISAGWNWNAALLADGAVMTWGFNSAGATGRVGSTVVDRPTPLLERASGAPVRDVVAISAGYNFGLALTRSGQLLAWGDNSWGQLGQGNMGPASSGAVPVQGLAGVKIRMAVAGGNHALLLTEDGRVLSRGYSQNGELGDGANHPRVNASALPAPVVALTGLETLSGVTAIAAGYNYSLALREDGKVLAWGAGLRGAMGQGPSSGSDRRFVPVEVKDGAGTGTLNLGPVSQWPNLPRRAR